MDHQLWHTRLSFNTRRLASVGAHIAIAIAIVASCGREGSRSADTARVALVTPPRGIVDAVTDTGIGPLRVGMTVREAQRAIPGFQLPPGVETTGCAYATGLGMSKGISVMVDGGIVARFDVDTNTVATAAGARVGDSEQRIRELYGSRLSVSSHKYTVGHYLTIQAVSPKDTIHRIIFETDGSRVLRFRAGQLPQVGYVERCG